MGSASAPGCSCPPAASLHRCFLCFENVNTGCAELLVGGCRYSPRKDSKEPKASGPLSPSEHGSGRYGLQSASGAGEACRAEVAPLGNVERDPPAASEPNPNVDVNASEEPRWKFLEQG